jgi:hypothetical protein
MMNRLLFFTFCCIICVGLFSCEKNTDIIVPDPNQLNGPDTTWYNSITENMSAVALKNEIQSGYDIDTVSLNGGTGLNFITASSLYFSINPGSIITGTGDVYLGNMIVKSMIVACHNIKEYTHTCHNKKFDMRYSPDVLINTSGSGCKRQRVYGQKNGQQQGHQNQIKIEDELSCKSHLAIQQYTVYSRMCFRRCYQQPVFQLGHRLLTVCRQRPFPHESRNSSKY